MADFFPRVFCLCFQRNESLDLVSVPYELLFIHWRSVHGALTRSDLPKRSGAKFRTGVKSSAGVN